MSRSYVKRDDSNTKGGEVMNCKDVAELLPLFIDAELEPEAAAEVEAHLTTCAACQEILAEYRREQQILQSLPLVAPPPTWRAELLEKVNKSKPRWEQPAWRFFVPRLASLAAALLVVLMVSNLYVLPTYWARADNEPQQRMGILAAPGELNNEPLLKGDDNLEGVAQADPPSETEAKGSESEADLFSLQRVVAAAPANNLQRRWWLWSSGISIVIWLAGAGYFYYNYRRRLQEQLDS